MNFVNFSVNELNETQTQYFQTLHSQLVERRNQARKMKEQKKQLKNSLLQKRNLNKKLHVDVDMIQQHSQVEPMMQYVPLPDLPSSTSSTPNFSNHSSPAHYNNINNNNNNNNNVYYPPNPSYNHSPLITPNQNTPQGITHYQLPYHYQYTPTQPTPNQYPLSNSNSGLMLPPSTTPHQIPTPSSPPSNRYVSSSNYFTNNNNNEPMNNNFNNNNFGVNNNQTPPSFSKRSMKINIPNRNDVVDVDSQPMQVHQYYNNNNQFQHPMNPLHQQVSPRFCQAATQVPNTPKDKKIQYIISSDSTTKQLPPVPMNISSPNPSFTDDIIFPKIPSYLQPISPHFQPMNNPFNNLPSVAPHMSNVTNLSSLTLPPINL